MTPGYNRTPFKQVHRAMSGEIVNEFNHVICNCDNDVNPKAINQGNAAYLEMVLNSHQALLAACKIALQQLEGAKSKSGVHASSLAADIWIMREAISKAEGK